MGGAQCLLPGMGQPSAPASSQSSAGGQGEQADQAGFLFGTFSDLGLIDRSVWLPHTLRENKLCTLPPSSSSPTLEGLLSGAAALTSQRGPFLEVSHPPSACKEVGLLGLGQFRTKQSQISQRFKCRNGNGDEEEENMCSRKDT